MKKAIRISALILCLLLLMGGVTSVARPNYTSFNVRGEGITVASPDAYLPYRTLDSVDLGLSVPFNTPTDIHVDDDYRVYISDPQNNRIVIFDRQFNVVYQLDTFVNSQGVDDSLSGPRGVYVIDNRIYVSDTQNGRIVVFGTPRLDARGSYYAPYLRNIPAPRADVFPPGTTYLPVSLVVDRNGRLFVISAGTGEGILSLDPDGSFSQFIGAPRAAGSVGDTIAAQLRSIFGMETEAQEIISTPFNNITSNHQGLLLAVTDRGLSNPVRLLNATGIDVMRRHGGVAPGHEQIGHTFRGFGASATYSRRNFVDVAAGPERTFTIVDNDTSRIMTYDENGRLLFGFGDRGNQMGNLLNIVGVDYQGTDILVLDSQTNSITVFRRTPYGDTLISALAASNQRRYMEALEYWTVILRQNNNFGQAYVGIGLSHLRNGEWEAAREMFRAVGDTSRYSDVFRILRSEIIEANIGWVILGAIAIIVFVTVFMKIVAKINKSAIYMTGKRGFVREVTFAFHIMFRFFDGFWDLKREKRGSVRGAIFWLSLTVFMYTYNFVGRSWLFTGFVAGNMNMLWGFFAIMLPLIIFAAANWCLTTLFDGEGSFKDIFIALGYATAPLAIAFFVATIITHPLSLQEADVVNIIMSIGWVWFGLLLFFGMMVTHDYSILKNIVTITFTIAGMTIIMFLAAMFTGLIIRMVSFVANIVLELSMR
ncbi:MAG: YIP1 family protein [Oscillospiraceae bacterium]|nr:YIP1 family protein [Oscillospiraceae bacterium]